MQNKYFGDKHDFYKYYFLKEITKDYSLGIHWCLNNRIEENNNDGKFKLTEKEKRKDEILYNLLVKYRHKDIKYIEPYFPKKTKYYKTLLKEYYLEHIYEDEAIEWLKTQDIIFFDPDNGIEVKTMTNEEKNKFVTYRLLIKYWNMGKSLIIYQHERGNRHQTEEKIKILFELVKKQANVIKVIKGSVTFICFIQGDKHYIVKDEIARFKQNKEYTIENWNNTGDIM